MWRADRDPHPFVLHGGAPKRDGFTLDDVFARNMVNARTLGVSPSGRRVGFSNPNDFFDAVAIGLDAADDAVQLPPRYGDGSDALERPEFCGLTADGLHLVVAATAEDLFVVDAGTGAVVHHRAIDFPYGEVTGVAKSPDGRWLLLSIAGGSALLWDLTTGDLGFFAVPPHTSHPAFVGERLAVMGHHDGAAVGVDLDAIVAGEPGDEDDEDFELLPSGAFAMRRDEDGEPCDDPWQVFEQGLSEFVSFAVGRVGAGPVVASCDDGGSVALYAVEDGGFRALDADGIEFDPPYDGLHAIAFAGPLLGDARAADLPGPRTGERDLEHVAGRDLTEPTRTGCTRRQDRQEHPRSIGDAGRGVNPIPGCGPAPTGRGTARPRATSGRGRPERPPAPPRGRAPAPGPVPGVLRTPPIEDLGRQADRECAALAVDLEHLGSENDTWLCCSRSSLLWVTTARSRAGGDRERHDLVASLDREEHHHPVVGGAQQGLVALRISALDNLRPCAVSNRLEVGRC
ncbi:MAG: hypothetical protein ABMA64_27115 [Myxococcota bacterium]